MDERPDQILEHIEAQRDRLGYNLNELESRVKETTDWRVQFEKRPMVMMGVAMGGGLLLGAIVGGGGSSRRSSRSPYSRPASPSSAWSSERGYAASSMAASSGATTSSSSRTTSPVVREQKNRAMETLDSIKAALIAFGAARAKEYLSEMLPGFQQHLDEAERKNQALSGSGSQSQYRQGQSGSQQGGAESYPGGSDTGSYAGSDRSYESGSSSFNGPYEGSSGGAGGFRAGSGESSTTPRTPGY